MSLAAHFELKIDGGLAMEIRVHPKTSPDAIADMLEDAATSFRDGFEAMMTCGDNPVADSADPGSQSEAHEPPPVGWKYFNYNPAVPEAELTTQYPDSYSALPKEDLPSTNDSKPRRDFHEEAPLIGEILYSINGIPAVKINYHPAMGISEIADILEDATKDLRKELEDRNPLLYDPDTVSLTVPAMCVGTHITNMLESYNTRLGIALEMEDYEAADKFFSKSEKFFEWMYRNYTPIAIKNSPNVEQLSRRIESFKGIYKHNGPAPTTPQGE